MTTSSSPAPSPRADMFLVPSEDPRQDAPGEGDERSTLVGFLRWQRQTLELKCSGLDPEQLARRALAPSTISLLGLVRHMAEVECRWFRYVMDGQTDVQRLYRTPTEPDLDFDGAVADPEVVAEAWAAWRAEVAFADRFIAGAADLGVTGKAPDAWRDKTSLRWLLVHLIEEYARHNGHADLLREHIDGAMGL